MIERGVRIFCFPNLFSFLKGRTSRGGRNYRAEDKNARRTLTLVALVLGDLLGDMLDLEQQLDTLNWRYGGFGDSGGNSTGDEVLGERHGIHETRHFVCVLGGVRRVKRVKKREEERRVLTPVSGARRTTSERA